MTRSIQKAGKEISLHDPKLSEPNSNALLTCLGSANAHENGTQERCTYEREALMREAHMEGL